MKVELDKRDIIHLLRGVEITKYTTTFKVENLGIGEYIGGFADRFEWDDVYSRSWDKYSEKELYELYLSLTKE